MLDIVEVWQADLLSVPKKPVELLKVKAIKHEKIVNK